MKPKRRLLASYCVLLVSALLCSACPGSELIQAPNLEQVQQSTASALMLVRHGSFLYRIGGSTAAGIADATVLFAQLDSTGQISGSWQSAASLPEGRSYGAAFSLGRQLCVVGGYTPAGLPSDSIFTVYVDLQSGQLGFGSGWSIHNKPLPEGRAKMAALVHNGAILLAGGETPDGLSSNSLYTFVNSDGYPSHWYSAARTFPTPFAGASVCSISTTAANTATLLIAGAEDALGAALPPLSVVLGPGLQLAEFTNVPLPSATVIDTGASAAMLIPSNNSAVLISGARAEDATQQLYRFKAASWTALPTVDTPMLGPSYARASGAIFAVSSQDTQNTQEAQILRVPLELPPAAPEVFPGSGILPAGSRVRLIPEPGTIVRFRSSTEPIADVYADDPEWDSAFSLQTSVYLAFKAFALDGEASALVQRHYQLRPGGTFTHTEPLAVQASTDGSWTTVGTGWYFFNLQTATEIAIHTRSTANSTEASSAAASALYISLFESDLCRAVPHRDTDQSLTFVPVGSAPVYARLPAASWYIYVHTQDFSDVTETLEIQILRP